MKIFGNDIHTENKGYFGVRRCTKCNALRDVNLVEIFGTENIFFIPIKKFSRRRFLVCQECESAFEINKDLWNYYNRYSERFDKPTTDEIIKTLDEIHGKLEESNVELNIKSKECQASLNMIFSNLTKKYNNPENIEELISIYFS